jgi:hypothetical protein
MIGNDERFNYKSDSDFEDDLNKIETNNVNDGSDSMDEIFLIDRADARSEYLHSCIHNK